MSDDTKLEIGLSSGMNEKLSGDVDVLGPGPYLAGKGPGSRYRSGEAITSNTISAVISVTVKGEKLALLPGDMDYIGLKDLKRQSQDLSTPILVYPHHGGLPGSGSKTEEFCKMIVSEVSPTCVIFSIARRNHNTPNPKTISSLFKATQTVRVICTQLSERCSKTLPSNSPKHLANVYATGRDNGYCCGGTVVISLDDFNHISPIKFEHADFIRDQADTAPCQAPAKVD